MKLYSGHVVTQGEYVVICSERNATRMIIFLSRVEFTTLPKTLRCKACLFPVRVKESD